MLEYCVGVTDAGDVVHPSGVPYFCQWESPELAPQFIEGFLRASDDPRWAASGARTPAEYEFWSNKTCGLACLKMILAWRGLPVPATMHLVERALAWKAYIPQDDHVAGLIYRPFADWVGADYGIGAEVAPDLPAERLAGLASPGTPVIASVHKWVRWPDRNPPGRGGHLVLVTGAAGGLVRLHNPSGIPGASQQDALVKMADFGRFFAQRGVIIRG
ncbi:MAG TPA: peptidase [Streptosporangiaceae bacterium]|nr:peptidase [Streptosporangiaceae bacterium]